MYRVTFNRAHEEPRQIATAQKFAEALAAAKKRELCCTKEREAGKILSSMSPGTKATTISRSGSKRLGAHVREPCVARRDLDGIYSDEIGRAKH